MIVNDGLGQVRQGAYVDCFEAVHQHCVVTEASDRSFNPLLSRILIKTVNLWSVTTDLVLAGYY